MNIYTALQKDHDIQRKLLDDLVDTSGDTEKRAELFKQLKVELAHHADSEERYFYVPLIKLDSTQDDARHGIAEHHVIDKLVAEVEAADPSSGAWLQHAKNLAHKVRHHLEEEEKDYFPVAKKVLSADRSSALGDEYQAYMLKSRNNSQ